MNYSLQVFLVRLSFIHPFTDWRNPTILVYLNNKTSYELFYVRKWFSFLVFECDDPTHNPSSVQILSLLTQFSGLATLQSLVSGEALQVGLTKPWSCLWGVTTSHITPVCLFLFVLFYFFSSTNFAKGLCQSWHCLCVWRSPSSIQKLSLLTQFSGWTTLQYWKGARPNMVLSCWGCGGAGVGWVDVWSILFFG